MYNKYVILKEGNIPIIFPRLPFSHYDIAFNKGEVKSAGFFRIRIANNTIKVSCFGSPTTLQIKSNPDEDNQIIQDFIVSKKLLL